MPAQGQQHAPFRVALIPSSPPWASSSNEEFALIPSSTPQACSSTEDHIGQVGARAETHNAWGQCQGSLSLMEALTAFQAKKKGS